MGRRLIGFAVAALTAAGTMSHAAADLEIRRVTQTAHTWAATSVQLSADDRFALSRGGNSLKLWDVSTGRLIRTVPTDRESMDHAALSPDGKTIVVRRDNAMILWDSETGTTRNITGEVRGVFPVEYTPDGNHIYTQSPDADGLEIAEIGIRDSKIVKRFQGTQATPDTLVVSPDSAYLAAYEYGGTIRIWKTESAAVEAAFDERRDGTYSTNEQSLQFSSDSKMLLAAAYDSTARVGDKFVQRGTISLWDVAAKKRVFDVVLPEMVVTARYQPEQGEIIALVGTNSCKIMVWRVSDQALIRTTEIQQEVNPDRCYKAAAFTSDGSQVVIGAVSGSLMLVNSDSGKLAFRLGRRVSELNALAAPAHGSNVFVAGDLKAGIYRTWDGDTGEMRAGGYTEIDFSKAETVARTAMVYSPDGALFGSILDVWPEALQRNNLLEIRDGKSGELIQTLKCPTAIRAYAFSPDGRYVLTALQAAEPELTDAWASPDRPQSVDPLLPKSDGAQHLLLWDARKGTLLHDFPGARSPGAVAFSADGTKVFSYDAAGLNIWKVTGEHERHVDKFSPAKGVDCYPMAFSLDGSRLLCRHDTDAGLPLEESAAWFHSISLWDTSAAAPIGESRHFVDNFAVYGFSPDGGRMYITEPAPSGTKVQVYSTADGTSTRVVPTDITHVRAVSFLPGNREILVGSDEGDIRLYRTDKPGAPEVARLVGDSEGEWLALTPAGFYAASPNGGSLAAVVRGLKAYPIDHFVETLKSRSLVSEQLTGDLAQRYLEASRRVKLETILLSGLPPKVRLIATEPDHNAVRITVQITDQKKGGIGDRVVWRLDGQLWADKHLEVGPDQVTVNDSERIELPAGAPDEVHNVEIVAFNGAGHFASLPEIVAVPAREPQKTYRMYVLAVGIDKYPLPLRSLNQAENDATSFIVTLKEASRRDGEVLFSDVKPFPVVFPNATKADIKKAFEEVKTYREQYGSGSDVFVLFLAGHGRTENGKYYFLPQDFSLNPPPEGRGSTLDPDAISQDELKQWMSQVHVDKRIMIFDTCESAAAQDLAEAEPGRRGQELDMATAMELMQYATGDAVLAAANRTAFEESQFKHGLLTYTILESFKPGVLAKDRVTFDAVAQHAIERVPRLSQTEFGVPQVPRRATTGSDIPLGFPIVPFKGVPAAPIYTPDWVLMKDAMARAEPGDSAAQRRLLEAPDNVQLLELDATRKWAHVRWGKSGDGEGWVPYDAISKRKRN